MDDQIGKVINGYVVEEFIGKGGMGAVYRARHPILDWKVALKVILPEYMHEAEFARRIDNEASIMKELNYPHIVSIYDYRRESDAGTAYLFMRYMNGGSLQDRLRVRPLTQDETLRLLNELALALGVLQEKKIIHRDLKPANVLFDDRGSGYLSDFGLAKDLRLDPDTLPLGTMAYAAPEQIFGGELTHQADIYSLGIILYECLTGENPFARDDNRLRRFDPSYIFPSVSARLPDLPKQLDEVIRKATAWKPEKRYPKADDLAKAFHDAAYSTPAVSLTAAGQAKPEPKPVEPKVPSSPLSAIHQRLFVCHSSKDDKAVDKLREGLHKAGVATWVDHFDISASEDWRASIENALETCRAGILVLSPHAAKSDECRAEWERMLRLKKILFVVRTEEVTIPYRLAIIQYVDLFPDFEAGLAHLIDAFQKSDPFSSDDTKLLVTPTHSEAVNFSPAILVKTLSNILARAPNFVGHQSLMSEVQAALGNRKRVLLWGFRGSGKTVLAAEIASQFVLLGQVLWLEAHKRKTVELVESLATPLKMPALQASGDSIQSQWISDFRNALVNENVRLIVLDNVLSDETTLDQVLKIIPPEVPVLATSYIRYPLDVVREVKLDDKDALELFVSYANGGEKTYTVADPKVKVLCEKLANHAFALELAARRIKQDNLTLDELSNKITYAVEHMSASKDYLPPYLSVGTQNVAALIENTVNDLHQKQIQTLFLAFGGLSAASATPRLLALYIHKNQNQEAKIEKGLTELQRRGLVKRVSETETSAAYYRPHDLAYLFVREKFMRSRKSRNAPLEACRKYTSASQGDLNALEAELNNLMGAADEAQRSGQDDLLLDIMRVIAVSSGYIVNRGYNQALVKQLDKAIEIARKKALSKDLHYFLSRRGNIYSRQRNLTKSIECFQEATDLARPLEMPQREIMGLGTLSSEYADKGDLEASEKFLKQAEEKALVLKDEFFNLWVLEKNGYLEKTRKNFDKARTLFARQVEASKSLGDPETLFYAYLNLSAAGEELGKKDDHEYGEAIKSANAALQIAREQKNPLWSALCLLVQGLIYRGMREYPGAIQCFRQARDIFQERGNTAKADEANENLNAINNLLNPKEA